MVDPGQVRAQGSVEGLEVDSSLLPWVVPVEDEAAPLFCSALTKEWEDGHTPGAGG